MSARTTASWQTSLADLSLILFMIAAAAINRQQGHLRQEQMTQAPQRLPSPEAAPLAIYLAAPDGPPLSRWLAGQAADPRQRLTVTVPYGPAPGDLSSALLQAGQLADEAARAGYRARIVVEPGPPPARAVLAFDDVVARSLLAPRRRTAEGTSLR
nr:hypothetical protein [Novosphingobium panipatense]